MSGNLAQIVSEARQRGFTHVVTMAGPLELGVWTPYGNGIEKRWNGEWVAEDRVRDKPLNGHAAGFYLGVWQFTTVTT